MSLFLGSILVPCHPVSKAHVHTWLKPSLHSSTEAKLNLGEKQVTNEDQNGNKKARLRHTAAGLVKCTSLASQDTAAL